MPQPLVDELVHGLITKTTAIIQATSKSAADGEAWRDQRDRQERLGAEGIFSVAGKGTAGLHSLGTRPTPVRADPRGQEGA
jgi:hypothetical protein